MSSRHVFTNLPNTNLFFYPYFSVEKGNEFLIGPKRFFFRKNQKQIIRKIWWKQFVDSCSENSWKDRITFPNIKTYRLLNIGNLILLGQCAAPRIGWQIDPFGHSSENARLFKWLGFDGLFFARNDYREKEQMVTNKSLDLIWNAGETLPGLSKYYFL